jgi:hypothetical protein
MRYEDEKIHRDDLAEIWRSAEQRRSLELFAWIKDYFRVAAIGLLDRGGSPRHNDESHRSPFGRMLQKADF